jgi:small redox-active disulfide protein 2
VKQIKILGSGCARCERLADTARQAAEQLGIEYQMEKVKDLQEYPRYGLMMTPGLVIDGELKVQGKVPSVEEIKALLA